MSPLRLFFSFIFFDRPNFRRNAGGTLSHPFHLLPAPLRHFSCVIFFFRKLDALARFRLNTGDAMPVCVATPNPSLICSCFTGVLVGCVRACVRTCVDGCMFRVCTRFVPFQGLDFSQLTNLASGYAMTSNVFFAIRGILTKKVCTMPSARGVFSIDPPFVRGFWLLCDIARL